MLHEFKSFGKIERVSQLRMTITQKLHGTNAQIYIYEDDAKQLQVLAGSRSRWLSVHNDNYGFANFVEQHKEIIIDKLGIGRHFGEWCGPGINNGEGLTEKTLFLFNWRKWNKEEIHPRIKTVPLLYFGDAHLSEIDAAMHQLKVTGSRASLGFMTPEGIVIEIAGTLYKRTFDIEEVKWGGVKKERRTSSGEEGPDISHLLQPLRLEKLLSRDEEYTRNYPKSLPEICKAYIKDLEEEGRLGTDPDLIKIQTKGIGRKIFPFLKSHIEKNNSF